MNKFIAITVVLVTILTTFMCFELTASAADSTPAADWVLGDFSVVDSAKDWKASGSYVHNNNIVSEVTRIGKDYALKWTELGDGTNNKNNKMESIKRSGDTEGLGKILEYKYLVIWMYSDKANSQGLVVNIYDHTTGAYVGKGTNAGGPKVDWTGWKPLVYDISSLDLTQFNKDSKTAAVTDQWYIIIQGSGWSQKPLADTLLYVDSIYFTNTNPTVLTDVPTDEITSDIRNNMRDIAPTTKSFNITSNKALKVSKDAFNDKIEVYKGKVLQQLGTDYVIQSESNKLSVKFKTALELDESYKVILKAGAPFENGTETAKDYSVTFTVNQIEFEIKSTDFAFSPAALPASGDLTVSLPVTNLTGSAQTGILYVGVYDKTTNQMIALGQSANPLTIPGNTNDTFTATVSAPSYANCYVRAFLWNNLDDMYSFGDYGELK